MFHIPKFVTLPYTGFSEKKNFPLIPEKELSDDFLTERESVN
jgi:hypothetical protein